MPRANENKAGKTVPPSIPSKSNYMLDIDVEMKVH
jgi:hypothetical protein